MDRTQSMEDLLKSPSRSRYSDRFVPARAGNSWHITFPETPTKQTNKDVENSTEEKSDKDQDMCLEDKTNTYSCLLKNEVLGYDFDSSTIHQSPKKRPDRKLFHYDSAERPLKHMGSDKFSPYSTSPVSSNSQTILNTPQRRRRRISKTPYKILDAPDLADDFYLNLLDWSSQDVVAVGLGTNIYVWSASNAGVSHITDMSGTNDHPTCVKWNEQGNLLAIGTSEGHLYLWDVEGQKSIVQRPLHCQRIGAIDWAGDAIITGSRDRSIKILDHRSPAMNERTLESHTQEICGLKWSEFNSCLASGGNDNTVKLWSLSSSKPTATLNGHAAAVKALSWSPHMRHVLASGGGTQDRCLKFWNTLTSSCVASIDTTSQVCNVAWSPHANELVSTHGYAHNHIAVWKYPSQKLIAKLKGHTHRVLYMCLGPDGESICTGASDETLRFWKVFEKVPSRAKKSPLDLFDGIR